MPDDLWTNPRRSPQQEAFVNLLMAYRRVTDGFVELFREHGLTEPRYDVLRILRNAGPEGLPSQEIGRRLYTRVPDVTRLVDGLVKMGLVERERCPEDRRRVWVRMTRKGLRLLKKLDKPVVDVHKQQFPGLSARQLETLSKLLLTVAKA